MSEDDCMGGMDEGENESPVKRLRRSGRRSARAQEEIPFEFLDEEEEEVATPTKKKSPRGRGKQKKGRPKKKAEPEEDEEHEEPKEPTEHEEPKEQEEPQVKTQEEEKAPKMEDDMEPMEEEHDDFEEMESTNEPSNEQAASKEEEKKPEEKEAEKKDREDIESIEADLNDTLEHHDTEMVSEDELPSDGPKVPLDTEAVSDEELPGPTQAELLDTEAVSEDELPPVKKKRKHRRHSSESEKRPKTDDKDSRDSESPNKDKEKSKTGLPELDKYWKAVIEDPSDFTGWTYLLQYVDQENDVDAARDAYDKFLYHYPYCYGYWRKYADYEKRKGGDPAKCEEVFERGLKAIPLSVDLWLHFLTFCKSSIKDEEKLRVEFERAIDQCGLEFRSDRLWEFYIKWEIEIKNYQNAYSLYHRLLSIPTQGYKAHFESYEDFVRAHQPNKMLKADEFLELRSEVVQKIKEKGLPNEPSAAPPGDDNGDSDPKSSDEEIGLIRDRIIAIGKKIFKETMSEVATRWSFEEGIKRPYFHVKPLERCQLNTWREYLDSEIATGNEKRTTVLFERCLIACALYEEFWVKYIKYLETLSGDREKQIRAIYERACLIHHPKKPYLALNWASFEESHGHIDSARTVLFKIETEVPNMMLIHLRRINLERRASNYPEAIKLYDYYLANTKSRSVYVTLSVKYSRFCWKVLKDNAKGVEILRKAIEKNPDEIRLYVQLLDLLLTLPDTEKECVGIFDKIIERDSVDIEDKLIFAQRRIEYLEDFGTDIKSVQKAQNEYFSIMKQLKESRRHKKDDKIKSEDKKKDYSSTYSNPPTNYSSSYQGSGQYSQQSYNQPSQNSSYNSSDPNYQNYYSQSNYNNGNPQSWGGYNYYS